MSDIPEVKTWMLIDGTILVGVINHAAQGEGRAGCEWYWGLYSTTKPGRDNYARMLTWNFSKSRFAAAKGLSSAVHHRSKMIAKKMIPTLQTNEASGTLASNSLGLSQGSSHFICA